MRLAPALLIIAVAGAATAAHRKPQGPTFAGDSARYSCADGRQIEVLYGGDAAVVTIGGEAVQMTQAAAADGARYTGHGWQWWAKGTRNGLLAPLSAGEELASAAGTACNAR